MKTINRILLTLVFVCSSMYSFAVTNFGVKGGVNFSNVYGEYIGNSPSMKIGFHVGVFVDFGINDNFSFVPEILFTTKGFKRKVEETNEVQGNVITEIDESTLNLSYIAIPLVAQLKLESGLYFDLGPYIGFLTSATVKNEYSYSESANSYANIYESRSISSTEGLNTIDAGLIFGIGYRLSSGLGFAARYDLGLADIYEVDYLYSYTNGTIGLTVNYVFGH